MNKRTFFAALRHYGSWQQLLEMINSKLSFYLCLPAFRNLLEVGGLLPEHILDPLHFAYFSDAIAMRCLTTHNPQESDDVALERCITEELHAQLEEMERTDRTQVTFQGQAWHSFPFCSLERFVWRNLDKNISIVLYLAREEDCLFDEFHLEIVNGYVNLRCLDRLYHLEPKHLLTLEVFQQSFPRCFQLATEDRGYFVPDFIWLPNCSVSVSHKE